MGQGKPLKQKGQKDKGTSELRVPRGPHPHHVHVAVRWEQEDLAKRTPPANTRPDRKRKRSQELDGTPRPESGMDTLTSPHLSPGSETRLPGAPACVGVYKVKAPAEGCCRPEPTAAHTAEGRRQGVSLLSVRTTRGAQCATYTVTDADQEASQEIRFQRSTGRRTASVNP